MGFIQQHKVLSWSIGIISIIAIGYWQRRNIARLLKMPMYMALDPVSATRFYYLNPVFKPYVAELIQQADALGWDADIVSGYRTYAQAKALVAQLGAQNAALVSYHNFGTAVDMNFTNQKTGQKLNKANSTLSDWENSGIPDIARKLNLQYGGDFQTKDINHFDFGNIYSIAHLKQLAIAQFGSLDNTVGADLKIS